VTGVGRGGTAAPAFAPAWPNPFHGRTTFHFTLPRAAVACLRVYDVAGREVATLIEGPLPAGPHDATWTGAGAAGPLPSGLYFCRLGVRGGGALVRRAVLLH